MWMSTMIIMMNCIFNYNGMRTKSILTAICAMIFSINVHAQNDTFKPFILNGTNEYSTLQEAIEAAGETGMNTIEVKPCPSGTSEYDAGYATNISGNVTANGAEIFTRSKSLTIKGQAGYNKPVLKDFVIVMETSASKKPGYTLSNLAFSGKSIIIPDNAHGNFGKIEVYDCQADVTNRTAAFSKLKNGDSVGATYASGTFMQWCQRSSGTTDELLFHDNEIVTRLSAVGGNIRVFNGGMMTKKAIIKDNVFGNDEHPIEDESGWLIVSQCTAKDAILEISDNTIYQKGTNGLLWILATGVTATGLDIAVHGNDIHLKGVGRPRFDEHGDGDLIVYIPRNYTIAGKVRVWHNYINGYCFNEVYNALGDAVTVDKQIGHTYGDGHIHAIDEDTNILVRKYGVKREDITQKGFADAFDGVTHSNPVIDLGNTHYCDRCNEILSAVTVTASGLEKGESVFFEIRDSASNVAGTLRLTGTGEGTVSKTMIGLEPGTYTVSPALGTWSWTYNVPTALQKDIPALSKTENPGDFTFEFSLSKKSGISVRNAENYKANDMK